MNWISQPSTTVITSPYIIILKKFLKKKFLKEKVSTKIQWQPLLTPPPLTNPQAPLTPLKIMPLIEQFSSSANRYCCNYNIGALN